MRQRITPPRLLIELVIAAVLLIVAASGALVWRVIDAPLALDRLAPVVEQALDSRLPGLNPRIAGGVFLAWDAPDHSFVVIVHDLAVGPTDAPTFVIPEISLSFDRVRILRAEFLPKTIMIQKPRFEVERGKDGVFRLAGLMDAPASEAGSAGPGGESLAEILAPGGQASSMIAGFERLGVQGASLLLRDETSGLTASAEGVNLSFQRVQGAWTLTAEGHAAVRAISVGVRTTAVLGPAGWRIKGKLDLASVGLNDLRRVAEALEAPMPPQAALLEGRLAATLEGEGEWDGKSLRGLRLLTGTTDAGINALTWTTDPVTGASGKVERSDLKLDWRAQEGALRGSLRLTGASVAHADIPAGAIDLRSVDVSGVYDLAKDAVSDGRVEIDSAFTTASATVAIEGVGGPMTTTLQARASGITFDDLKNYWPAGVAPNPRRWMLANISRGVVSDVTAKAVAARSPTDGSLEFLSLNGTIDANGMRIQYIPRMPVVEQAAGSATFDLTRFDIKLISGSTLRQKLQRGRIEITGLHVRDQDIAFDLNLAGPLISALEILDSPPLGYVKRFGVPLNDVAGEVATRLVIKFPLENKLTFADVKIAATAEATGVKFGKMLRGLDVTDGALQMKVDQDSLALTGRVNLMGQPFAVEWAESFAKAPAQRRSLTVTGDVDDALRRALGIDVDQFARGPFGARIAYVGLDERRARVAATLDLRRAALVFEPLGYAKPIGAAAELRLEVSALSGVPQTADLIRLTSDGMSASGRGRFSPEGELSRVDLDRLRYGENDLSVSYLESTRGALISLVGPKLDLRAALKDKPDKPKEPGKPFRVDLKVASARVSDDLLVTDLQGRVEHDGLRTRSAELTARAGGGLVRAAIKPGQGGRDLAVDSDDSGTLLQAMGLTQSVRGGKLRLTGWYDDSKAESPLQGRVEIVDSRVVGAPILSRLLQLASVTGIPELLSGEGVAFQTIVGDFVMLDDSIDLKEMRASGLSLGVLLRGRVDRVKDTLDLSGTLVPIYGLNRVLGAIPLLGDLLTGGDGGGLFAFTFAVRGAAADPDISVNALSVLAPGLLRRLFEYAPGGDAPAASPAPGTPRRPGNTRD